MHRAVLSGPLVDLAAPLADEAGEAFEQRRAHQAEDRLRPQRGVARIVGFERADHGDLRVVFGHGLAQALGQVEREEWGVARHRQEIGRFAALQAGQEAGQRTGIAAVGVGPDGRAEGLVGREIAVGVDHHLADLHAQPQHRVQGQRRAVEILQALVDAAHARAAPAGEHQARDVLRGNRHPPM